MVERTIRYQACQKSASLFTSRHFFSGRFPIDYDRKISAVIAEYFDFENTYGRGLTSLSVTINVILRGADDANSYSCFFGSSYAGLSATR